MKIEKAVTKDFESYQVIQTVDYVNPYRYLGLFLRSKKTSIEQVIENVTEADDKTGLVVQQVVDKDGYGVYTNGEDDISLDNCVKLLLLTTTIKQSFLGAGFRPKLTSIYLQNLKIVRIGTMEEKLTPQLQELS